MVLTKKEATIEHKDSSVDLAEQLLLAYGAPSNPEIQKKLISAKNYLDHSKKAMNQMPAKAIGAETRLDFKQVIEEGLRKESMEQTFISAAKILENRVVDDKENPYRELNKEELEKIHYVAHLLQSEVCKNQLINLAGNEKMKEDIEALTLLLQADHVVDRESPLISEHVFRNALTDLNRHNTSVLQEMLEGVPKENIIIIGPLRTAIFATAAGVEGELTLEENFTHVGVSRSDKLTHEVYYRQELVDVLQKRAEQGTLEELHFVYMDPLGATYKTIEETDHLITNFVREYGITIPNSKKIVSNTFGATDGVVGFMLRNPGIKVVVSSLQKKVNSKGYVEDGVGDAGDRAMGKMLLRELKEKDPRFFAAVTLEAMNVADEREIAKRQKAST